jgi:hypothetical protein
VAPLASHCRGWRVDLIYVPLSRRYQEHLGQSAPVPDHARDQDLAWLGLDLRAWAWQAR